MKSVLRFVFFVALLAVGLALVYWLRVGKPSVQAGTAPTPSETSPRSTLETRDREFTDLVASVLPSVVSIDAIPADAVDPNVQRLKMLFGGQAAASPSQLGSGVIVSDVGHIVTNFHVINGAGAVQVHLNDGRIMPAKYLGADPRSDVAILKIDAEGLQPAKWGDSDQVRIGQGVFAVGNPLGLQETVTHGIISGKGRRALSEAANEFFQTDTAINQGNSGGPLFEIRGNMIGITNMVTAGGEGIAFAIPSNIVRRVFESIRDHGRFIRPWFGTVMRPLTPKLASQLGVPTTKGALLVGTYEKSPAALAGLLPGDVIVSFNNKPIIDHIDLRNRIAESPVGQDVTLQVLRKGEEFATRATIAAEPSL
ncbi:MAG: trypsin-like peptidase domain-containing protein [Terrimicrobiaceae bacterium]